MRLLDQSFCHMGLTRGASEQIYVVHIPAHKHTMRRLDQSSCLRGLTHGASEQVYVVHISAHNTQ